ncbi:exosortase/archaeosortase family protein [Luteolibacter marinus]|uniref:exosortase/archaeosortase family protein n=1 Tax=Luteolibacter marinus TaxID=2776705 RepID=UPI001866BC57|nr:exosortase/archaeosortase family protein [Luteolibacter marinus]
MTAGVTKASAPPADPTPMPGDVVLVTALWIQVFAACIYGWRFGEYYDYGWYVPPLTLLFAYRLRGLFPTAAPLHGWIWLSAGLLLTALLTVLRVVGRVDPRWTLPLWIQAAVVLAVTLWVARRRGGTPAARRLIPVLLFACTAIPLPSVLEKMAVTTLTDSVISSSAVLLGWLGRPVEAIGDQLGRLGEVVHVTEGCSGIRSAQSFLMVSLFFGEWMSLRARNRWLMVGAGLLTAWTLNVIRASALAWIRFEHGEAAFGKAHDVAGLLAFAAGSATLLGISKALDRGASPRRISRQVVEGGVA